MTRKAFNKFSTRTAVLGTSHIREVLQSETRNLTCGEQYLFKKGGTRGKETCDKR